MIKYVIGPALTGAAYLAGMIYGSSAEQLVGKPVGTVYSAMAKAAAANARDGEMRFDDGSVVPYSLSYEGTPDQRLLVRMATNGKQAAEADIDFAPQADGQTTLMILRVHADNSVLREAFANTPKARIGYAPDWMLNIAMKAVLKQAAADIEAGKTVGAPVASMGGDPRAGWTDQQRKWADDWQQYNATRPAIDPGQAAQNYLAGQ